MAHNDSDDQISSLLLGGDVLRCPYGLRHVLLSPGPYSEGSPVGKSLNKEVALGWGQFAARLLDPRFGQDP